MARGRPRRPWIKLFSKFLESSINYELTLAQQAIFIKLILLAGECNDIDGFVADNDGRPFPLDHIAHRCYCSVDELKTTLELCEKTNRCTVNGQGIGITNWKEYQAEYPRQKPYRQAAAERNDPDKYQTPANAIFRTK